MSTPLRPRRSRRINEAAQDKENMLPPRGKKREGEGKKTKGKGLGLALAPLEASTQAVDLKALLDAAMKSPNSLPRWRVFLKEMLKMENGKTEAVLLRMDGITDKLPKKLATLNIWLELVELYQKSGDADVAVRIFEHMDQKKIGQYYKRFYIAWATAVSAEPRANEADVKRVLALACTRKVLTKGDVKKFEAENAAKDDDVTIVFNGDTAKKRAAAEALDDEKTVALETVVGNAGRRKRARSSTLRSVKGKKNAKYKLGSLSKFGAPTRVLKAGDSTDEPSDTLPDAPAVEVVDVSKPNPKPFAKDADLSYIKNWKPKSVKFAVQNEEQAAPSQKQSPPRRSARLRKQESSDATIVFHDKKVDEDDVDNQDATVEMTKGRDSSGSDNNPTVCFSGSDTSSTSSSGSSLMNVSACAPSDVSGELRDFLAPKNIFHVNGKPYIRLSLIGRGGSSKVFKVLSPDGDLYALKRIKLQKTDKKYMASFTNEITLLNRLRNNPNIICLIDSEVNLEKKVIYMVMELGEEDLSNMLQQQRKEGTGTTIPINFVRLMWANMLEAVHTIHEERIVHGDLKPANFIFVKGKLKLIDFGIAKAISNDTTNIYRDTQVGTLNYMSPEAILDTSGGLGPLSAGPGRASSAVMKLGRASDTWSLGCILYQMVYGRTPFSSLKLIQKIRAITDPDYCIEFPTLGPGNALFS